MDGFRFDLMGHHMKSNMLNVRAALDDLTLAKDGVMVRPSTCTARAGTSARCRHNARASTQRRRTWPGRVSARSTTGARRRARRRPLDSGEICGATRASSTVSTTIPTPGTAARQTELDRLLNAADLIRVGLAGNLADYTFIGAPGAKVSGDEGAVQRLAGRLHRRPAGKEHIYISKHDNQTLYDNNSPTAG
jgi:pullulanase/glycogen debranching enzyme